MSPRPTERGVGLGGAEAPRPESRPEPYEELGQQPLAIATSVAPVPAPRNRKGPGCDPPAPLRVGATEEPLFAAKRNSLYPRMGLSRMLKLQTCLVPRPPGKAGRHPETEPQNLRAPPEFSGIWRGGGWASSVSLPSHQRSNECLSLVTNPRSNLGRPLEELTLPPTELVRVVQRSVGRGTPVPARKPEPSPH